LKLIDANVFIYARGQLHPYRQPCREFLSAIQKGRDDASIDTEVLQEVVYIYWYRRTEQIGLRYLEFLLRLFQDPFPVDRGIMLQAHAVLRTHPRLDPRDAIHAAVVMTHNLEGIVSTDRGFDSIPGLTRFDPMDL